MNKNSKQQALVLDDVCKTFHVTEHTGSKQTDIKALDHVSFEIFQGETFALVGESGSGKTTTGRIVAGLEKADSGRVVLGEAQSNDKGAKDKAKVQFVFQDPLSALDPRYRIQSIIAEPLTVRPAVPKAQRVQKVRELTDAVGLPSSVLRKYPHELSGGQRQRVNIARALIAQPQLIVLDEPVSALDVSVQAQVLNLLKEIQAEFGMTFLFISHDMAVVRFIADRAAVMRKGSIVETSDINTLFSNPQNDYTKRLLDAIPVPRFA